MASLPDEIKFTSFALLPVELQLKIWTFSLEAEPRILRVEIDSASNIARQRQHDGSPPPPCLSTVPFACRTSYQTFKELFLQFKVLTHELIYRTIRFSVDHDIIYLKQVVNPEILALFLRMYQAQSRHIKTFVFAAVGKTENTLAELRHFPCLEKVVVNICCNPRDWEGLRSDSLECIQGPWECFFEEYYYEQVSRRFVRVEVAERLGLNGRSFVKRLEKSLCEMLEKMRRERWPTWKAPVLRIVESEAEVLLH